MKALYYNEINTSKLQSKVKKIEKYLCAGDYKSAQIKKIQNSNYYRARLDDTNRLLFKFAKYEDQTYILFLEVILNHDYQKSKFLRGSSIDESKINFVDLNDSVPESDIQQMIYVNPKQKQFNVLDKFISFDDAQSEIYKLPTPLIIIGSAGSGKTALTLEKLKMLHGNVAYISLSQYLVENAQSVYYSNHFDNPNQEVDFLSFSEYIESIKVPKGSELQFRHFEGWFTRHIQRSKVKEPFRLFEEFKGVLTGSIVDKAYMSRNDYMSLGVRQSIFLQNEREHVYDIFEKYLAFLNSSAYYDTNIIAYEYLEKVSAKYDYIVVDEVQDITNIQLSLILKSLKNPANFILTGDSNQIVHPNFFSWSKIKTLFFLNKQSVNALRFLHTNYRNSHEVTGLSNLLLKIKNARFGSIDKESTYLIDTISSNEGEAILLKDNPKLKKELNSKTQSSTKYAILVMNNEDKRAAAKIFKTPLIFSIQEAKGLEYENIILLNFVSSYDKEFFEITKGVTEEVLEDDMKYARAKNKEDKDLEVFKFFINSLYVAFTRAVKNLIIIEDKQNHKIFELLKLRERKEKLNIQAKKSNREEWLEEAKRLELQGKIEQAQQIRSRMMGVEYITPEELERLKEVALAPVPEAEVKRERKQLYRYAEAHKLIDIIEKMAELNFMRAIGFMKEVKRIRKEFAKDCRLDRMNVINQTVEKYGVDFRSDEENMTGLMLSINYNSKDIYDYFVKKEANIKLKSEAGLTPAQIAIRSSWRTKNDRATQESAMDMNTMSAIYDSVKPSFIRIHEGDRKLKIGKQCMEYFLLNYMKSVGDEFMTSDGIAEYSGFTMNRFMDFIADVPEFILPEYRRKRQYVNSILANNEVERDFIYNKKLFKRIGRGIYIINPDLKILD